MMRIAIIGFGVVGQGFLEVLNSKKTELSELSKVKLVAIADPVKGSVYCEDGLDTEKLLQLVKERGHIKDYPAEECGWDSLKTIRESDTDVIVELTPTNIETGEPGYTHIKEALTLKKHVVTTNKGPIALYYHELMELAQKNGVKLLFEGTVVSGTPVIRFVENSLRGAKVLSFRGIVNGTTNYILTKMEEGASYEEALKSAQSRGYAETDPTNDVEGYDALAKLVILAKSVVGIEMSPKDVKRTGITNITKEDIEKAKNQGKTIKLLVDFSLDKGKFKAQVAPTLVDKTEILASIRGVTNAIEFTTDILGKVYVIGPGAGGPETGFAVFSDLIELLTS